MPNQATTLPTVEDLMLEFAARELERAKARWHDKQISDDYAYSNGSKQLYEAPIEHWTSVVNTICETYSLDRPAGLRHHTPLSPTSLSAIADMHSRAADDATTHLHNFEEDNAKTLDTTHYQFYLWHLNQVKEAKRLANFFAYLCKRPHPFAGVDMLPEDIG